MRVISLFSIGISFLYISLILSCSESPSKSNDGAQSSFPEQFHVSGNQILNDANVSFVFMGFNPPDPLWQGGGEDPDVGALRELTFQTIRQWGASIVRLSVYPATWRRYGATQSLVYLDQAVAWCSANNMYAIIDFHSIGYPPESDYQPEPDIVFGELYVTTKSEMYTFWKTISAHYSGDNRVIFYELFNEPVRNSAQGYPANNTISDWNVWKQFMESVIDTIRVNDSQKIVMVGGFQFAYDLSFVNIAPIADSNVVYSVHPYPDADWRINWDSAFGNVSATYPVFASEFGFDTTLKLESSYQGPGVYRDALISYLNARNIGWTAWSFSNNFPPSLLIDTNFTPSVSGAFFRSAIPTVP